MSTNGTTTWTLDRVEAAIAADSTTEVGHLTMWGGQATLPDAADGAPVFVSAAQALEAITQHGGLCWVDESGHLVGWPEEGPDPEPDLGDYDIARYVLEGAVRAVLGDDAVAEASYLQETHRLACARWAIARTGREWVWDLPRRVVIGAAFDRGRPRPAAWLADQPGVIVWLDEPSGRPDATTAEALVEDLRAAGGDV